jgi:hypothetical protein
VQEAQTEDFSHLCAQSKLCETRIMCQSADAEHFDMLDPWHFICIDQIQNKLWNQRFA